MALSIVIPTHNRSELLRRTLLGLCGQERPDLILEVLVVDDGSSDSTPATLAEFAGRIPVRGIHLPKGGVSVARNRGIREARGELVLLLDDDVVPGSRLVLEHSEFHRRSPQPETVLLGYVTWLPELRVTPFMRWYGEYGALFGYALLDERAAVDPRFLYSCNVSFKTGFLRSAGCFNENLTVFEDRELGFRLAARGMRMMFNRKAVGFHNQSFTFQQACDRVRRYSPGFAAFLATDAGREMTVQDAWWKRRLKRAFARHGRRPDGFVGRLIDSDRPLPHFAYRIAYWYFATLPNKAEAAQ